MNGIFEAVGRPAPNARADSLTGPALALVTSIVPRRMIRIQTARPLATGGAGRRRRGRLSQLHLTMLTFVSVFADAGERLARVQTRGAIAARIGIARHMFSQMADGAAPSARAATRESGFGV